MDWTPGLDCGTPFVHSRGKLRIEIAYLTQYRHMLAPWLAKAGFTYRQFALTWATRLKGPTTVANLADVAEVDRELALDDIRALERDGFVTLEVPPWQFETPEVETTDLYDEALAIVAPAMRALEGVMHRVTPDPSHPWQGPPPRV